MKTKAMLKKNTEITKQFATLGNRQIHYLRAGSGPPVLLLHKSPESSEEFRPLMLQWANDFTMIAPDTPGYGLSDPIDEKEPDLAPFADVLVEFLDCLGIEAAGVYGTHTGAMIAAEFASLYPDRVTVTIINGYLAVTEEERKEILDNYFADFTPKPDGSHMVKIWTRIRDQFLFFPWAVKTDLARKRMSANFDLPDPEYIQRHVLDLLRTGIHEPDGYGAAFRCDGPAMLSKIKGECYVMAHRQDLLFHHLDRLPNNLPSNIQVERFDTPEELNIRARKLLKKTRKDSSNINVTSTGIITHRSWQTYVKTKSGQAFVRRSNIGWGRPVVLIHDFGSSSLAWVAFCKVLIGKRPFIAFDLPGHGETRDLTGDFIKFEDCAIAISEGMEDLGIDEADIFTYGGGGLVALKLVDIARSKVKSLTCIDFWLFNAKEKTELKDTLAPTLLPSWYGEHMVRAWFQIRDSELFWPWYKPVVKNSLLRSPDLDPIKLHQRTVDLLKSQPWHSAIVNEALSLNAEASLRNIDMPITFSPGDSGPHVKRCQRAAALAPGSRLVTIPNDSSRHAATLLAMLKV